MSAALKPKLTLDFIRDRSTPEPNTGCWLWTHAATRDGYGVFWDGQRTRYAHRLAWQLISGRDADSLDVCHRCDMPSCVNPDHLFTGTARDNMRDAQAKGRTRGRFTDIGACVRGHSLLPDSPHVRYRSSGYRYCNTCKAEAQRCRRAVS